MQGKMIPLSMARDLLLRVEKDPIYITEALMILSGRVITPIRPSIRARVATFYIQRFWRGGHGPLSSKMRLAKPISTEALRRKMLWSLFMHEWFSRFMPYRLLNGYRWLR